MLFIEFGCTRLHSVLPQCASEAQTNVDNPFIYPFRLPQDDVENPIKSEKKKVKTEQMLRKMGKGGWEQEKKKFGDEKSEEIETQNHLTDQMSRRPVHIVWMMVDVSGTGYGGNSILLYPLYDMSNNTSPTWIKTNLRFIMKTNAWWSIAIVAQFLFRFSPECMLPTCDRRRY